VSDLESVSGKSLGVSMLSRPCPSQTTCMRPATCQLVALVVLYQDIPLPSARVRCEVSQREKADRPLSPGG